MLAKLLRVLGGMTATAGILVCLSCVAMLLGRSPADSEGMIVGAAIGTVIIVGLPLFMAGVFLLSFARSRTGNDGGAK